METNVAYKDLKDRQVKVKEQEAKKLRMTQDNFDPDWKEGSEPFGTMIFTNEPSPEVEIVPSRDLLAEIDKLEERIKVLESR